MKKKERYIFLVPIGDIDKKYFPKLCDDLSLKFELKCFVKSSLSHPEYAYSPKRRQYLASRVLSEIKKIKVNYTDKVLGITDVDLYAMGLNFVFGQAELEGRNCLISVIRLDPRFYHNNYNENLFYDRILKEAVHELGHTFGLRHCDDRKCVMVFSNSLLDTDYKSSNFCEKHRQKLKKIL